MNQYLSNSQSKEKDSTDKSTYIPISIFNETNFDKTLRELRKSEVGSTRNTNTNTNDLSHSKIHFIGSDIIKSNEQSRFDIKSEEVSR